CDLGDDDRAHEHSADDHPHAADHLHDGADDNDRPHHQCADHDHGAVHQRPDHHDDARRDRHDARSYGHAVTLYAYRPSQGENCAAESGVGKAASVEASTVRSM